jgi:hypothetical protein
MKELDLLKKDWKKKENAFEQISETEIYKMIHKKSSSIVKWIFIISILEVALWLSISLFFNTDMELEKLNNASLTTWFKTITIVNYVVIAVFIILFYRNYTKITTTVTTKQLMNDILKTRKTVQYYVWYNLGIFAVSMIMGVIIAFGYNPKTAVMKDQILKSDKAMILFILAVISIFLVFFGLFWLFYRLLYGILLKKLHANYNELKKIDL